jgi:hypothetical protein
METTMSIWMMSVFSNGAEAVLIYPPSWIVWNNEFPKCKNPNEKPCMTVRGGASLYPRVPESQPLVNRPGRKRLKKL